MEDFFKYRKANIIKFPAYGFFCKDDEWRYRVPILNGQFLLTVIVDKAMQVKTVLTDTSTNEIYTLHLIDSACGQFIESIRNEYRLVLKDIAEKCFDINVFKSEIARYLIGYVQKKYNSQPEYLWKKFPENAVWRRNDNRKWFGALLRIPKNKLGISSNEIVEIIDLRMEEKKIAELTDNRKYFAGYHMNKRHWLTVCLDGSVPVEEIYAMLDESYLLAK